MTTIRQWARKCANKQHKEFNQAQVLFGKGYTQALNDWLEDGCIINKYKGAYELWNLANNERDNENSYAMGYAVALDAIRYSIEIGREIGE